MTHPTKVYQMLLCSSFVMAARVMVPAQAQFEGIIQSNNTTTDERGSAQRFTMTMFVKDDKVRIENSSIGGQPGSTMIYRGDKKVVWMLNEDERSYVEIRQDQQAEEMRSPGSGKAKPPVVRMTGKKKRVLRYPCDQIVVEGEGIETEVWATRSLGQVYATISKVLGGDSAMGGEDWERKVMRMGYYPLIASSKLMGKVVESQEVTSIEKKSLADHLFELPATFTKQSVGREAPE